RPLRREPHGRDRAARPRGRRGLPGAHRERRPPPAHRRRAVHGLLQRARRRAGRPDRLPPRPRAVPPGRERRQHRGGLRSGPGARDTLRLEAGLPLSGTDMDETTTPLEAGLAWVVKLDKGDFVGRAVLAEQAARGVTRRLVGLELAEPGVPRHGYPVWRDGAAVGTVTSGTRSPTLGTYIGLAYVSADTAAPGTP